MRHPQSEVTHLPAWNGVELLFSSSFFAEQELESRRPLLPSSWDFKSDLNFSPTVVDTLETFRLAAKLPKKSLGAYVISQCQQASDILAVMVLQQNAG